MAVEQGHSVWGYTYVDWVDTAPSMCPEQVARAKAREDWSVVVWTRPEGGEWVEVAVERPDGMIS